MMKSGPKRESQLMNIKSPKKEACTVSTSLASLNTYMYVVSCKNVVRAILNWDSYCNVAVSLRSEFKKVSENDKILVAPSCKKNNMFRLGGIQCSLFCVLGGVSLLLFLHQCAAAVCPQDGTVQIPVGYIQAPNGVAGTVINTDKNILWLDLHVSFDLFVSLLN